MDNNGCEEYNNCNCIKPRKKCRNCGEYILGILSVVLAVILGLIIGADLATAILEALSALIIFAITVALLIIIRIVTLYCRNN